MDAGLVKRPLIALAVLNFAIAGVSLTTLMNGMSTEFGLHPDSAIFSGLWRLCFGSYAVAMLCLAMECIKLTETEARHFKGGQYATEKGLSGVVIIFMFVIFGLAAFAPGLRRNDEDQAKTRTAALEKRLCDLDEKLAKITPEYRREYKSCDPLEPVTDTSRDKRPSKSN